MQDTGSSNIKVLYDAYRKSGAQSQVGRIVLDYESVTEVIDETM